MQPAIRLTCLILFSVLVQAQQSSQLPTPNEGNFILHNFHFKSGESLPELRMHYYTFGKPQKDASGKTTNAVLILHGTGGSGRQFLRPMFSGVLFGPGQPLGLPEGVTCLEMTFSHTFRTTSGHSRSS
jgi:homoserine O-acetyltransferase